MGADAVVALPGSGVDAARREGAGAEGDGVAARERHHELAPGGKVTAGRDEAVSFQKGECVVDGTSLDDAVEVEPEPGRPADEEARQPHLTPASGRDGVARRRPPDLAERAVVPCGGERCRDRGVAEAGRGCRRPQRVVERCREERGDDGRLRGGPVQALQVGVGAKAAQCSLEGLEQPLDRERLGGRRAADDDLATHRAETMGAHEVWVDACGGWVEGEDDGSTEPEPKNESLCAASWLILDETPRPAAGVAAVPAPPSAWPPRTTTERTPKPTAAAPAAATFTKRARRRAAERREGEEVELTSP
jgi:hypothetical protein